MLLSWLLVFCIAVAAVLGPYLGYRWLYAPFQLFRDLGIKGPPPQPLLGNMYLRHKLGYVRFFEYLHKKYGPVAGYYKLSMPWLSVTDLDIIKHIHVKEFDCFTDRPHFPDLVREASAHYGLLTATGEEWRTARCTLSPSFSTAKIKAMVPLIKTSVDTLVEVMGNYADSKSFDIYKLYSQFTMETILATAFGQHVEILKGESNAIVKFVKDTLKLLSATDERFMSFRNLLPILVKYSWLESPLRFLVSHTKVAESTRSLYSVSKLLVQQRRETSNPQKYKDILQLMLDATVVQDGGGSTQQKLTDDEIVSHGVTLIVAAHETTCSALSYISYHLAIYPTIQEKVQLEIDDYFKNNPEAELYDAAQEMEYLDKVMHESLRLLPPVHSSLRHCLKTTVVNGVTIPKGVNVVVPVLYFHHDPKYWKDPETFDPERFSAEEKAKRSPLCWLPFSYGPRNCIGMRLAMLEMKLTLIFLLRKYTFVRAPETEVPLSVTFGLSMSPKHGVFLKVVKRN